VSCMRGTLSQAQRSSTRLATNTPIRFLIRLRHPVAGGRVAPSSPSGSRHPRCLSIGKSVRPSHRNWWRRSRGRCRWLPIACWELHATILQRSSTPRHAMKPDFSSSFRYNPRRALSSTFSDVVLCMEAWRAGYRGCTRHMPGSCIVSPIRSSETSRRPTWCCWPNTSRLKG
jgi:hypothetical protein